MAGPDDKGPPDDGPKAEPGTVAVVDDDASLDRIVEVIAPPEATEAARVAERDERRWLNSQRELEHAEKATLIASYQADVQLRARFAPLVGRVTSSWMAIVVACVLAQGFGGVAGYEFALTNEVMVSLVGGATASILGTFWLVVQNLFPKRNLDIQPKGPPPTAGDPSS